MNFTRKIKIVGNKIIFIISLLVCLIANISAQGKDKPNVLFILIDDLGWKDVGFMGSTYHKTPNVDAIAQSGMVFMNAYSASPLCSATRSSIISGTWPARNGLTSAAGHLKEVTYKSVLAQGSDPKKKAIEAISASRISPDYFTLGEAFKKAGYITAHIGKWHIGEKPSDPFSQGFDVDIPHTNAPSPLPDGWFAPWPVWPGEGNKGDHLEDRMAEEAVKFIRENNPSKTGKPFLLNYWAFSVHSPWEAKQEIIDKYELTANFYEAQNSAILAAMVENMDDAVGQLMTSSFPEKVEELDSLIEKHLAKTGGVKPILNPDYKK